MEKQDKLYTIQQLSQRLDIPKPTLRFWERELDGIIDPIRTNGGQRRYRHEHIQVIEEIKSLQENGMSLSEIKEILANADITCMRDPELKNVDILASRIAKIVKEEIYRFLNKADLT